MATTLQPLSRALEHHHAGEFEQAEHVYETILATDPTDPQALHLLGVLALQTGDHSRAIEKISTAIAIRSDVSEYHNSLAAAYRTIGKLEEAIASGRRAVDINPNSAEAHNNLGNSFRELGDFDEAKKCFHKALEIRPKFDIAQQNLDATIQSEVNAQTAISMGTPGTNHRIDAGHDSIGSNEAEQETEKETKTVLHVGCGHKNPELLHDRFRNPGWKEVRLDINPAVKPDIVASLCDMKPVESTSVDAVWSSHNIEHLFAHEVPLALDEFFRVLKPGGIAFITLPDLMQIAKLVADDKLEDTAYISPAGPITPLDCIFGLRTAIARGNEFMAHRTGFTAKTLRQHLSNAGFVEIRVWSSPLALWAEGTKS